MDGKYPSTLPTRDRTAASRIFRGDHERSHDCGRGPFFKRPHKTEADKRRIPAIEDAGYRQRSAYLCRSSAQVAGVRGCWGRSAWFSKRSGTLMNKAFSPSVIV